LIVALSVVVMEVSTAASPARAATSGGAYIHQVECKTGGSRGMLETEWPRWYTPKVRVALFRAPAGGTWVLQDAVVDYPYFQSWKMATRQANGQWTYDFGSTALGKENVPRGVLSVGIHAGNQTFQLARGYWYSLRYEFINPYTGVWEQVATNMCWMY
jgi:hypothetical protein